MLDAATEEATGSGTGKRWDIASSKCPFLGGKTSCASGVRKGRKPAPAPTDRPLGRQPVGGTETRKQSKGAKAGINSLSSVSPGRRGAGSSQLALHPPNSSPVPNNALREPKRIPEHPTQTKGHRGLPSPHLWEMVSFYENIPDQRAFYFKQSPFRFRKVLFQVETTNLMPFSYLTSK